VCRNATNHLGCHAERERSICFSDTLLKADSSPAAHL
jgi:hypothetical protein